MSRGQILETFADRLQILRGIWSARRGEDGADQDFAALIGLTPQNYSGLKNSVKPPPYDRVLDIARRAGVDPGWLMFGSLSEAPAPAVGEKARRTPAPQGRLLEETKVETQRTPPPKRKRAS